MPGELTPKNNAELTVAARGIHLQQWLIGTYHGVSRDQLQVYLDEFVFRHNRRRLPMAAFQTLLGLGAGRKPTAYNEIRGAADLSRSYHRYWGLLKQPYKQELLRNSPCLFQGNEFEAHGFRFSSQLGFLTFLIAQLIGGELAVVEFLTGGD